MTIYRSTYNAFKIYIIVAERHSTFWKVVSKFPMATAKHILKIMRMNSMTIEALSFDFMAQYHWTFRTTLPNLLYFFCTLINIFILLFYFLLVTVNDCCLLNLITNENVFNFEHCAVYCILLCRSQTLDIKEIVAVRIEREIISD